mmetsp:Transcript_22861/g.73580  ORF Transcript_22861/g.73580 Transcript_22861/m.73580 type:complete len:228 (+) Transcript_22861:509-1192(+)
MRRHARPSWSCPGSSSTCRTSSGTTTAPCWPPRARTSSCACTTRARRRRRPACRRTRAARRPRSASWASATCSPPWASRASPSGSSSSGTCARWTRRSSPWTLTPRPASSSPSSTRTPTCSSSQARATATFGTTRSSTRLPTRTPSATTAPPSLARASPCCPSVPWMWGVWRSRASSSSRRTSVWSRSHSSVLARPIPSKPTCTLLPMPACRRCLQPSGSVVPTRTQ